ncbi:MAG: PIN domain-containing protein [Anaerolineales bacterium]|jgi:predicted nucleic acid-binding protein
MVQGVVATKRIVIDANVLFTASINSKSTSRELYRCATEGRVTLILCPYTLSEVRYNLSKKNYTQALDWFDISLAALKYEHAPTPSRAEVRKNRSLIPDDPNDVPYLVLAKETKPDYIVSRDHHLLDLGEYHLSERDILIVKPDDFLILMKTEE